MKNCTQQLQNLIDDWSSPKPIDAFYKRIFNMTYAEKKSQEDAEYFTYENGEKRSCTSAVPELPPCPEDPNARFHMCFGAYTYKNGIKYVGEWKDDKKNGQGTYNWPDGDKYVGEYKDGKRNGQGTLTHADGAQYVGKWADNKFSGRGTYTYANGNKYVGEWAAG